MNECLYLAAAGRMKGVGETWPHGPQELANDGVLQEGEKKTTWKLWKDLGAFHREGM